MLSVAGPDARLPRWLEAGEPVVERPRFDSAVVRGNGIGALVCAARLARSEAFRGRVTLASPQPQESRRLIGGLTLRARSLDYYAGALGCEVDALLGELFGTRAPAAQTREQRAAVCDRDAAGGFRLARRGVWMDSERLGGRPLAYGTRNSALVAALQRSLPGSDLHWHDALPKTVADARALAVGQRPVVIDASGGEPFEDLPEPASPRAYVLASQLPFADARRADAGVLGAQSGFLGVMPDAGRWDMDVCIFNPIVDRLSPAASAYGIAYRMVSAARAPELEAMGMRARIQHQAPALEALRQGVRGVAEALGLQPVDEDATLGQAVLPCYGWSDVAARDEGVVELRRIYDTGAPIITGDGMARAGLAAMVVSECLLAGEEPTAPANRALRTWRRLNRMFALGMTRFAPLVEWGTRRWPGPLMGGGASVPEMWARVEART